MIGVHQPEIVGGGVVGRRFTMGTEDVVPGQELTAEQINEMPDRSRRALIKGGYLVVRAKAISASDITLERFVVSRGGGKFDVIAGAPINPMPLTKKEADALAAGDQE
jgi:hypothetical protein